MSYRFQTPTTEQARLLRNNGIDPEGMVVRVDCEQYICLLNLKTRCEITLYKNYNYI